MIVRSYVESTEYGDVYTAHVYINSQMLTISNTVDVS